MGERWSVRKYKINLEHQMPESMHIVEKCEDISNRHKNYIEGLPLATFETTGNIRILESNVKEESRKSLSSH